MCLRRMESPGQHQPRRSFGGRHDALSYLIDQTPKRGGDIWSN
jgi:hypothetical protein